MLISQLLTPILLGFLSLVWRRCSRRGWSLGRRRWCLRCRCLSLGLVIAGSGGRVLLGWSTGLGS